MAAMYTVLPRPVVLAVAAHAAVARREGHCLRSGEQGPRAARVGRSKAGEGVYAEAAGSDWDPNIAPPGSPLA